MVKTAICGIGNLLRGDDGIGPAVIELLSKRILPEDVLLLDCSTAPESFAGKIIRFAPDRVLVIDAVEMGESPGKVAEISLDRVKTMMVSTHKMPVNLFINYLERSLPGASIIFIGVQQKSAEFGQPMSGECAEAAKRLEGLILGMVQ